MEFLKKLFSPKGSLQRIGFFEVLIYSFILLMLGLIVWFIFMMIFFGSFLNVVGDHTAFIKAMTEFQHNKPNTYILYMFFLNTATPILWGILILAFLWVQFCGMLKRLVDLGLSRWLVLIPYLSVAVVILYSYFGFNLRYVTKLSALVILLFFLFLLFMPSQRRSSND